MCIFCERAQAQIENGFLTIAQKREVEQCEVLREKRIKATILTGFLGSGKTTFLNYILKTWHGKRIGVVQNEFGSVSIDDKLMLVEKSDTEVVTMANGCICCRVRGDMVDALKKLAERPGDVNASLGQEGPPLDGLIIECSGLSEVIPVAQTFFADPYVQASFHLDGVVCVCDAANFLSWEGGAEAEGQAGEEVARLVREQLSISDVCLLNKCDLVTSQQRDKLSTRLRDISPSIKVVPCRHGKVNLNQVLNLNSFSVEFVLSLDSHFLGDDVPTATNFSLVRAFGGPKAVQAKNHAHDEFGSIGLQTESSVDIENLKAWLRSVVENHGDKLVRMKGVLRSVAASKVIIVQGVGGHIEVGEEEAAEDKIPVLSRLVMIGRLVDETLREELTSQFLALGDAMQVDEEQVAQGADVGPNTS